MNEFAREEVCVPAAVVKSHTNCRSIVLWTVGVVVTTAVILRLMGQPLWCHCGGWSPWSWDIWSSHNSQHLIDPYTITHVVHGFILCGLMYWLPRRVSESGRYLAAVVMEAGWEILENTPLIIERYRSTTISLDYCGDSVANSVADLIACASGYGIAFRLRTARSLWLFAATELTLVIVIRDSLILNIIMLVCPLEAIKLWQTHG